MIVVDSSVLVTALIDDDLSGKRARKRLHDEELAAPAIIDLEVASVIRKGLRARAFTADRAALALVDLAELPIERVPHLGLMRRVWELHHNVTPYDAAYVATAEALSTRLLTADVRLSKAPGARCVVELWPS